MLVLELAEPACLVDLRAAVLRPRPVEGLLADAVPLALGALRTASGSFEIPTIRSD